MYNSSFKTTNEKENMLYLKNILFEEWALIHSLTFYKNISYLFLT